MTMYRSGLSVVSQEWWDTTPALYALLLDASGTYVFDVEHQVVDDLVPSSNELVTDGYTRLPLTLGAATWNATTDLWELNASSMDFGDLGPGVADPTVGGIAIYEDFLADDSTSRLIKHDVTSVLLDGTNFTIFLPASGLLTVAGAP